METKHKINLSEAATGKEFAEALPEGVEVHEVGSYYNVRDQYGNPIYWPKSRNLLPAPLRDKLVKLLTKAFFLVLTVLAAMAFLG